jgi:hypothetical protein
MKKFLKWLIACFTLGITVPAASQATVSEFVSVHGKSFYVNGQKFWPVVMNYIVDIQYDASNNKFVCPHHCYGTINDYETTDAMSSFNALVADFTLLRNQGFNTVRIVGASEVGAHCYDINNNCSADNPNASWSPDLEYYARNSANTGGGYVTINSPYTDMFGFTDAILQAAQQAGVKVILLVGGKCIDSGPINSLFCAYLGALAAHEKNNPTLIGYDFYNEPGYFQVTHWSKGDVCYIVGNWTDIVHQNAPRHLTTIGLVGPGETIGGWDPGILKLDFISIHPYPYVLEGGDQNQARERVKSLMYWMKLTSDVPWIIGETGLSVKNDILYTGDGGTPTDQLDYATQTLNYCRDCGGAGYSWWQMYDVQWGNPYEDYFGLMTSSTPSPAWKPAAAAFQNFNPWTPGTCYQPYNYYNVYGYSGAHVYGGVLDQYGQKVPNAYIVAKDVNGVSAFTFSDQNGDYDLYANFTIYSLTASARAANIVHITGPSTHQGIILFQYTTPENSYLVNANISSYQQNQAKHVISANTNFYNGSTGLLQGAESVDLQSGFHAIKGSNVHLFNAAVRPDCGCVNSNLRLPNTTEEEATQMASASQTHGHEPPQPQQVTIETSPAVDAYIIAPNPNNGQFIIYDKYGNYYLRTVRVLNTLGETVKEVKMTDRIGIDMSDQPKGIYLVMIETENGIFTDRVVVQ